MYKYSLVLLAATAVLFNGCGDGGCCQNVDAPTAVIESGALATGLLSSVGSRDNNTGGTIVDYQWTVGGSEVDSRYILPVGTHEVCLTVTDNDGLTDRTCENVTINANANARPVARITAPSSCTAGDTVNVMGTASSDDGMITFYDWTPVSIDSASGTFICPTSDSQEVCLTVTDDGVPALSSIRVCETITVDVPEPPAFGLRIDSVGTDGFFVRCSSDGENNNIRFGEIEGNEIQEIYWAVTYNTDPEPATTTDWLQSDWNSVLGSGRAAHFCGKWLGGNAWDTGDTIDISATVLDISDNNTTYLFNINSSGVLSSN